MDKKKISILASLVLFTSLSSVNLGKTSAEDSNSEQVVSEEEDISSNSDVNAQNETTETVNASQSEQNSDLKKVEELQKQSDLKKVEELQKLKKAEELQKQSDLKKVEELQKQIDLISDSNKVKNDELKNIIESINSVEKELAIIFAAISDLENQISKKKEDISTLEDKLASLENDIVTVEKEIDEQKQILGSSLSFLYENRDAGFFQLFFQSENLTDFLKSIDFMNIMIDSNDEIFDKLVDLQDSLKEKQTLFEKDLASLNRALQDLNENVVKLEEQQTVQQTLLAKNKVFEEQKIKEIEEEEANIDTLNLRISTILSTFETYNTGDANAPLAPEQKLISPMKSGSYYISSLYGYRTHPVYGYIKYHNGLDFASPLGTPIYSAGNGTVIDAGPASGFGNWIVIRNDNGIYSLYGHMETGTLYVKTGDRVYQGQLITRTGNAGTSTGPHLHYGTATDYSNGKFTYIDPLTTFK